MQRSNGIVALVLLIAVTFMGVAVTAKQSISTPPLFRENKNAGVSFESRADDDLNYRLPNNTEPVHYWIELTTNVHTGDRAFNGIVTIELNVIEDTRTIVLHARQLRDFVASVKNAAGTEHQLVTAYEEEREFLSLTPSVATVSLLAGSIWNLTIAYNGDLRTDNGGFYLSTYTDPQNVTRYLATTQFESTNARHAFPCFDEPAKRATFTISINHTSTYHAISNMPVDVSKNTTGRTVFQTTPSMPTYLVAFIVSDFKWSEGVLNDLPQRIYSRPGTEHEQEWALVSGMLLTQRLAEYFDVKFSLPKLYQVAVPDFAAGAMENWGLATYREEYMLYNKQTSTVNTQTGIASIIGHEFTHQWFGDLVTLRWWTYLWLKEGFATLYAVQSMDDAYPEWDVWQMFHVDDYQNALNNGGSNSPRPMTHYVQKPAEISSLYDSVSYAKAGSVLSMWSHALTEKVFRRGLHNYLTVNQYGSAEEWQLFKGIQDAALEENYPLKDTINNMMSSWTQQGGFPLLTVERNYNDGSFTVKQEAFFNNETQKQEKTWYVPFNYATQKDPDFRNTEATHYLLNVTEIKVSDSLSSNDWLILNKQSTGFYRINYDDQNWHLIIDGLNSKMHKIHPRNRAQLIHDAYRFSSSNRLSQSILLSLMTYLSNEDQYAPWSTANAIITTFNRYLSGDKDYDNFKFFITELVSNIYEKLGANDIPGEHHFQKYTRNIAINLACLAGIDSCLEETNDKLKKLIDDGIEIEPNLQSQTYCNGLKQSGDREFDYVYNRLMESDDQAHRRLLITSLGCAQKQEHIKTFISSSINLSNKLRTQERTTLLSSAYSRGEVGLLACIDFLNDNWEAYAELSVSGFGAGNPLDSDVRGMSQYVVNTDQEAKLLALVDKVKHSDKVTQTLETSVQTNIKANFDWLDLNRDPLMQWVGKYRNGGAGMTASFMSIALALAVLVSKRLL